jgi:uncharacterized membrane protein YqiK
MESLIVLAVAPIPAVWIWAVAILLVLLAALAAAPLALGMRYIPHDCVGIVEKLWSPKGSVGEGQLLSLRGEAGYQTDLLRGGLHFFYWPWQYRIHKTTLTVVPQGKIGYIFARDGEPLRPEQTLARMVPSNNFQDARAFLTGDEKHARGQRGRQRAILREGVYAINLALFVVITEDDVYRLRVRHRDDAHLFEKWQEQLGRIYGFRPVVVGLGSSVSQADDVTLAEALHQSHAGDTIGIVTVHDGASLDSGQIIAPPVATDPGDPNYHNNFQDVEAFLRAGGRRGRQFVTLTDGTYFINRWFATIELIPKTVVPIGHVGVVVSYYGKEGTDVSGTGFRHGERVGEGERGVQAKTLSPGKYAFNRYAGHVYLVPTTNFVLHWITGRSESHTYDESLKSIDLVTADAYEPVLPLSVVVHIDYQKAANVVQRFGDVKKLITQTLDPLLSAYFRDIAHKKTMLQLLHERDVIQAEARKELQSRFAEFDIELVDVLIGKPDTAEASGDIETLLEQLRLRQLSREQIQTYEQQCAAADKLKSLRMAQAHAEKQTELSNSLVDIEIAQNHGEAELVRGRKRAEQSIVDAEAEHKRRLLLAESESRSTALIGEGESKRVALEGEAHARVLEQKIASFGDPRLYALSVVAQQLANSRQPLVPAHLFVGGGGNGNGKPSSDLGLLGLLVDLLVADKTGFAPKPDAVSPVATEGSEHPRIKSNGPPTSKST